MCVFFRLLTYAILQFTVLPQFICSYAYQIIYAKRCLFPFADCDREKKIDNLMECVLVLKKKRKEKKMFFFYVNDS